MLWLVAIFFSGSVNQNVFVTGVLMGAGDVIAQLAVERCPLNKYDPIRSSRYLIFGTIGLVSNS